MHKNGQICQKCAINCGIEGNASNENITKYKNLCGVKSISNSVQRLARYIIVALISIGRLCKIVQGRGCLFASLQKLLLQRKDRCIPLYAKSCCLYITYYSVCKGWGSHVWHLILSSLCYGSQDRRSVSSQCIYILKWLSYLTGGYLTAPWESCRGKRVLIDGSMDPHSPYQTLK